MIPDWFIVIIQFLSIGTMVFLLLSWRKTIRERDEAREFFTSSMTFINALADRGVSFPCDDCGNPLTPDVAIDVIEKDDGTIYVGHRSHNRRIDWGKATS